MKRLLLLSLLCAGCAARPPIAPPNPPAPQFAPLPIDCSHTDIPHCVVVEEKPIAQ